MMNYCIKERGNYNLKIGIDIDDTTFYTANAMIKYADIFEEERTGIKANRDSLGLIKNRYYLKELYGWDNTTKFDYFNKYYKNVLEECCMIPNANEVISKLKEKGHTIHFITARLMNIPGCDTEKITRNSLEKNGIKYDTLDIGISDKINFFKENNIEVCIEDSYETCQMLDDIGVKTILFTTKMNEKIDAGKIIRVHSWNEIYDEILKF